MKAKYIRRKVAALAMAVTMVLSQSPIVTLAEGVEVTERQTEDTEAKAAAERAARAAAESEAAARAAAESEAAARAAAESEAVARAAAEQEAAARAAAESEAAARAAAEQEAAARAAAESEAAARAAAESEAAARAAAESEAEERARAEAEAAERARAESEAEERARAESEAAERDKAESEAAETEVPPATEPATEAPVPPEVTTEADETEAAEKLTEKTTEEATEEATEAQKAPAMPRQIFRGSASNGVHIYAVSSEGAFPEATTMSVTAVSDARATRIAEQVMGADVADARGVDIKFYDAGGRVIEPAIPNGVTVTMTLSEALEGENFSVVHEAEGIVGDATASKARFTADSFSVYVIVGTETIEETTEAAQARVTYEFYNGDTLVDTQIVKATNGAATESDEVKEPDAPTRGDGVFRGWSENPDATEGDFVFGSKDLSAYTEDTTIKVYAIFGEAAQYNVFFMNGVGEDARVAAIKGARTGQEVTFEDVVIPLDSKHSVVGWYTDEALTNEVTSVTVAEEDITLWPRIESGNYLYFSAEPDASYTAPQFVTADGVTKKPTDPTRNGYEFWGWASSETSTYVDFTFGRNLSEDTTVYACWRPHIETKYTIAYWAENADDNGYSFIRSESATGTTGRDISLTSAQQSSEKVNDSTHFTYNRDKTTAELTGKTIAGDGSTIVNVYFSRNVYKLTFQARQGGSWKEVATITAKYAAYIADKFSEAPFNTTYNGRAWEDTGRTFSYALQTLDRMPGTDVTFRLYDQNSRTKKTIYYYIEKTTNTDSLDTWPKADPDETHYDLLKSVDTYFNYATYEEEYHEIAGFTRFDQSAAGFSNSRKDFKNYQLYLYYKRNSYDLIFHNVNTDTTKSVKYGASLDGMFKTVPARPSSVPADFTFQGWYTSEDCLTGTEAETNLTTMPFANTTVYAKWAAPQYTETVYLTISGGASITKKVDYRTKISKSEMPQVEFEDGRIAQTGDTSNVIKIPNDVTWAG